MDIKTSIFSALLVASFGNMRAYDFSAENADGKTIWYNKTSDTTVGVTYREDPTLKGSNIFYKGSVTIPSEVSFDDVTYTVTSIENNAFFRSTSLFSVQIPQSVTVIGDCVFTHCAKLASANLPQSLASLGQDVFFGCAALVPMEIPSTLTAIPDGTFANCTSFTQISIPSSVTAIGNRAFQGCLALTSIDLPASILSIGETAFHSCKSLTSIQIPESLTTIGGSAFYGCSSLESLTLPASITSLGVYAINPGPSGKLKSITVLVKDPAQITMDLNNAGMGVFANIPADCTLYVPAGCAPAYAAADQWKDFFTNIEEILEPVDTPEISILDNRIVVTCSTEGAQIHTSITADDHKYISHQSGEPIELTGQYLVTSYATAEGMKQSQPATAMLLWTKTAETPSGIDAVEMGTERAILIRTVGHTIEISGTIANENILLYNLSGQLLYSGKTEADSALIPLSGTNDEILILQVGSHTFKYKP